MILMIEWCYPFPTSNPKRGRKRLTRGMNEKEEAVPLRENFFKETDLRRSPCHRRTGPFLHPVFIFLSFFFLSILLVRLFHGPILLVVRNFFYSKVEIIGLLFPCFASSSLRLLRQRYSSVAYRRKVPKCSISCQIWRFIFTIGIYLSCSFFFSFCCFFLFLSPARKNHYYLKNRSCHIDIYFLLNCFYWREIMKILFYKFFLFRVSCVFS